MSAKPIIGITTYGTVENGNYYLPATYVQSVRQAGGLPLLLPPSETDMAAIFRMLDGVIFAGGGDLDPATYNGNSHPSVARVDKERDAFEIALAKLALAQAKPVLGICRGVQLLNVVSGGDLILDLPAERGNGVRHRSDSGDEVQHEVKLRADCRIKAITGKAKLNVISKHHQGLGRIASGWQVAAHAQDGIVEALEHKRHPWAVAVLWHPEMAPDDPNQQKIFKAFIAEAGKEQATSDYF